MLYDPAKLIRSTLFPAEFRTKLLANVIKVPPLAVMALDAGAAATITHPSKFKVPAVTLGVIT